MPKQISDPVVPAGLDGGGGALVPPKLAYTIKEWCAAAGMGPTKTFSEIKAGRLKTVWVAGRRLILAEDGLAYLRAGRDQASAKAKRNCAAPSSSTVDTASNPDGATVDHGST